jgi:hypothetical protein
MTMTRREELNLQAINVDKDIHTVVKSFVNNMVLFIQSL